MASLRDFFFGKKEKVQQLSPFTDPQQQLLAQLAGSLGGPLQGGLQNIMQMLSASPEATSAFQAPALRQFQEQILPSLAEGFGGLGATSSSGAQQTFARAGERLSESLAAQRAGLQQNAMQNLIALLSGSFPRSVENVYRPETFGLLGQFSQGLGQGLGRAGGAYLGGKIG